MMIQIVDDQDNLIGHKKRDEVDSVRDTYRSTALWVCNSNNEVLIAQRKLTKDKDPGMWGPSAAGTIEQGETYEGNVYKEAEEEIGLQGYAFMMLEKVMLEAPRKQFMQFYKTTVDKPASYFTPQPEEVEQVAWISLPSLKDDMQKNPTKYVPNMTRCIAVLERAQV